MIAEKKNQQEEIRDWFNRTYSARGEFYLRPVKAYYVFLELLKVESNKQLLDIACGLGRLLEAASEYGCKLSGIDISDVAVQKAQIKLPQADIYHANAEELPFGNDKFDYVTCLGSLERMLDRDRVLQEIMRVSNDNAKFCFLVRNSKTFSWKYLKKMSGMKNEKGHQDAMDLESWKILFRKNGFDIVDILHDQYPLHKAKKIRSLGLLKVNYKKPIFPKKAIEDANEFLFLLKKK